MMTAARRADSAFAAAIDAAQKLLPDPSWQQQTMNCSSGFKVLHMCPAIRMTAQARAACLHQSPKCSSCQPALLTVQEPHHPIELAEGALTKATSKLPLTAAKPLPAALSLARLTFPVAGSSQLQ